MLVKEFMIPASKVITVNSADPLEKALSRMVEKNVGCVVVLDSAKSTTSPDSAQAHPVGIVSKVRRAMGRIFIQCDIYANCSIFNYTQTFNTNLNLLASHAGRFLEGIPEWLYY